MSLDVAVRTTFDAAGAATFEVSVDLSVDDGETLVVLGPSGSGKTLLLETVAGYHDHDGAVRVAGRDVADEPPEARGFGFVFQSYALFPHMTVRENVDFGTRYHGEVRNPDELLAELGIADLADRTPDTLSGGEAQRVALARSLAIRPSTLLMDEPLSALDVPTRESLRTDLAAIIEDVTTLYVTHNRTTALELADRIAVMRGGRVVQVGTPDDVFERPATPFVARFTGSNCVPSATWAGAVDGEGAMDRPDAPDARPADGAYLAVRPEHVRLGADGLPATVQRVTRRDVGTRVRLAREGSAIEAYTSDPPAVGDSVSVQLPAGRVTRLAEAHDDAVAGVRASPRE